MPQKRHTCLMVGVGGGSGSGKTTLVEGLVEQLGSDRAVVVSHDWYYRDQAHVSPEARESVNFDEPDALETFGGVVRETKGWRAEVARYRERAALA